MNWNVKNILACLGMMFTVPFGDHLVVTLLGTLFSDGITPRLDLFYNCIEVLMHSGPVPIFPMEINFLFTQRNKAPYEQAIPLLMPQHHMVIPHYLGRSSEIQIESQNTDNDRVIKREDSFSSSSQDQDIPLLLPQESGELDTPEGNSKPNGLISFLHHLDTPRRISSGLPFSFRKTKIAAVGPDTPMKGFVDDLDSAYYHEKNSHDRVTHVDSQNTDLEWWETQERGDQGGLADESGQIGPRASCRCQVRCFNIAEVSMTYLNIFVSMT